MNKTILVFGCIILFLKDSLAVSFDCEEARTSMERAICRDKILSRLDDSLNQAYNSMKEYAADPVSL